LAVTDKRFIVAIKLNSHDFIDGGFDADDSREVALRLEAAGVDFIELSGGTYEDLVIYHKKESTRRREAFFIEYAIAYSTRSLLNGLTGLRSEYVPTLSAPSSASPAASDLFI
jgi:2,4-dienoyl-CoA reductase-like NADH-dependent reductase (Old Yellow Enzyme family)